MEADTRSRPRPIRPGGEQDREAGRLTGGNHTLQDLIDSGLLDTTSKLGSASADAGIANPAGGNFQDIVYHVVKGADGKQYLQGFAQVQGAQASRGFLESSQTKERQAETKLGYDQSVRRALDDLGANQRGSLDAERGAITANQGEVGDLRATIAGEQAQKSVPTPPAPKPPAGPDTSHLPPALRTAGAFNAWLVGRGIRLTGSAFRDRYWNARQKAGAPVPGAPKF
jgi:hypothetical protein